MRSAEERWAAMLYRPEPFDVPQSLKSVIDDSYVLRSLGDPVMFQVDLDDDGQSEYLLLLLNEFGIGYAKFYYLTEKGWLAGNLQQTQWGYGYEVSSGAIKNGDIELVDPRFKHLEIGGVLLLPVTN